MRPYTNPECKFEHFRPFSCKSFCFCPSCSQKQTLLFSEYMRDHLLMSLPHRQFVFTVPRILRPYFRYNRRLFSDVSRVIFAIIRGGRPGILQQGGEEKHKNRDGSGPPVSGGVFSGWAPPSNPHFHCLVLEGGFDEAGRFAHIPLGNLKRMSEYFRRVIIKFFLKKQLISAEIATSLINWRYSGFSVDASRDAYKFGMGHRSALCRLTNTVCITFNRSPMNPIDLLTDPQESRRMQQHLVKVEESRY